MFKLIFWLLSINWNNYRPANCLPSHCFCEYIKNGFIRQPVDAFTNLAYVFLGILMIYWLYKNWKKTRKFLIIFALANIAVGVGSFLYHASFTFFGMELDDDTMYLIGSFMLFFSLSRFYQFSFRKFLSLYLLLNLTLEMMIYFFPVIRGVLFGFLVLGTIVSETMAIRKKDGLGEKKYFRLAVYLFLLAYLFWISDYKKIICWPESLYQGHAVWHLLSALAGFSMFLYMYSAYQKKLS